MEAQQAEKVFAALGQETRLQILSFLARSENNEIAAGDISLALGIPQNTLSFHLNHLEREDLLNRTRKGRFIIYSLNARKVDELILYTAKNLRRAEESSE